MNLPIFRCTALLSLLGLAFLSPVFLCGQNELVPAPNAVQLQRIWTQEGSGSGQEYGYNVWGGVDLTGDSIADFGVHRRKDNTWLFYRGGNPPDTVPFWSKDSVGSIPPYCGDFWGDGRVHMLFVDGYAVTIDDFTYNYDRFRLFEVTPLGVSSAATVAVDQGKKEPPIDRFLREAFVMRVNNDAADDMIVSLGGVRTGQVRASDLTRQIWFYMGGAEFQLDSPTVVVRDTSQYGTPDNWEVRFADFDGDGRLDMVMGGSYPTGGPMLRFYWGDENSPWSWAERPPDRDVQLIHGQIGINSIGRLGLFDLDGDGAIDFASEEYEDVAGVRVYLSSKEDARTRTFHLTDADVLYTGETLSLNALSVGSPNDSLGRFAMLPLGGRTSQGSIGVYYVSGGSTGPDHDYDAWYVPGQDGLHDENVFIHGGEVGDVTGDGWSDILYSAHKYGTFVYLNAGVVFLLSGGPEIPLDDTTLSVAEYPVAGESGGLYLWPNPVVDGLHIAWKGNLKRLPARFTVYDAAGVDVVSGSVDTWRGSALWRCGSVAAGAYTVVAYDSKGVGIASGRIVKR